MHQPLLYPDQGAALIPSSLCLGAKFNGLRPQMVLYKDIEYVVVKYGLDLAQRLASIGVEIHSPIRFDYHWPGKFTPYDHQMVTSDFMVRNWRAFIFNDIGTGKTLSSIWAADYLMSLGIIKKVLIVSTLSTLHRVWEVELAHSVLHRSSVIVHGGERKREKTLGQDVDFYITNHDSLRSIEDIMRDRPDINMVIMDEGAVFRNAKAKTLWAPCNNIINNQSARWCWWMTGSPMPKAPSDLWAQAKIVNAQTVPKYFGTFRDMVMFKVSNYKWVPRKGWEDIAYSSVQPSIRFKRNKCVDLPDLIVPPPEMTAMSKKQGKAYEDFKEHCVVEIDGNIISAVNEGALRIKLLQIASGAIYHQDGSFSELDATPKFEALCSWIVESNYKLIIYVPFTHGLSVLEGMLLEKFTDISIAKLWGGSSPTRRKEVFAAFQDGNLNILLAHPKVMAHGLTMTAANIIVWWGAIDDYDIYNQANGRISRIGQLMKQYIIRLACCDKEAEVYRRLETKESMQGILLDMIDK